MVELSSVDKFVCLLQKCRKQKDLEYAKLVHTHICVNGLENHTDVGNRIVQMLVECGSLSDAHYVFSVLVNRNEHSWTSLISGYVKCGQLQHALNLYQKMREDMVHPTSFTLTPLLKACAVMNDIERGREMHSEITQDECERDIFVGCSLVSMYAKCGLLAEAEAVFAKLPVRDVVSWNALIAGYLEHAHGQDVLKFFEQMQLECISPDAVTFVCVLKACGNLKAIYKGEEIYNQIAQKGFERCSLVKNTLVDMYVKCGLLSVAKEVFENMAVRDVVSWNTLIAGYVEQGSSQEAVNCFEQMQVEGIFPDAVTYVCILKRCSILAALDKGQEMHARITRGGVEIYPLVGNTLVDMYAKCSSLLEAQNVFDKLSVRGVVSWTALIAGYAKYGLVQEALKCFQQMQLEGISPNPVTFVCTLKICGNIRSINKGQEIHTRIMQQKFEGDLVIGSSLVDMYGECGLLSEAREVFERLPVQQAVLWTTLIAAYAEHGLYQEALNCFEQMQLEGISPDACAFVCILKACGSTKTLDKGCQILMKITQEGFGNDPLIGKALVDMFAQSGSLSEAKEVLARLGAQDVGSWNVLIAGCNVYKRGQEVLTCFEQMQQDGISPNADTFVCVLKACGSIGAINKGRETHTQIVKKGFGTDLFIGSTLVDMYAKCGSLSEAEELFSKMPVQDVVLWNALIAGYAEYGPGQEVLKCFQEMQLQGFSPNAATYVCVLKASGSMGAIDIGRETHREATQNGLETELFVGSTLVDMYARCASLSEAQEVFAQLPVLDAVTWNALIGGYAMHQEGNKALQCFEDMQEKGVKPNDATFTCLLSACGHASLVLEARDCFKLMTEQYGIVPTIEHCASMIDLLARSGHLYEAVRFLETMPCPLSGGKWRALLSGCKTYGQAELGLRCFQQLVQMNPEDASSYMLMADIYASATQLDDADRIELLRKYAEAKRKPASALIEVNKRVHEFVVGSNQSVEILSILQIVNTHMKEEGHVPNLDLVLRSYSDTEKGA